MKKTAFNRRENLARWIFTFGVLASLFFSGGEGVRLLPFPIAEADLKKSAASTAENILKSYVVSAHNSGSRTALFESKFQKHAKQPAAGGHSISARSNACANSNSQSTHECKKADFLPLFLDLDAQSDRAPPAVVTSI